MTETNIVSISGGKDSLATALLAIERGAEKLQFVFADTGHEHKVTYDYIDYLDTVLPIPITRVCANFDRQIRNKRMYVMAHWGDSIYASLREEGKSHDEAAAYAYERVCKATAVLKPTGNPFLDLCLWKGRFPSTRRRFCSEQLKHIPMEREVFGPATEQYDRVVSWQGVRADESQSRQKLLDQEHGGIWEAEFGAGDPETAPGLWIYRPILTWTAEQCFDLIKRHDIDWNPLYEQGMSRVGCMPCIHAGKQETREIARRYPEEIARVAEWEMLVSEAVKRGASTFMDARITAKMLNTGTSVNEIDPKTHGINTYVDWAMTSRGGRQVDLIAAIDAAEEAPACSSVYGLCE